jgi:hypothetical protein
LLNDEEEVEKVTFKRRYKALHEEMSKIGIVGWVIRFKGYRIVYHKLKKLLDKRSLTWNSSRVHEVCCVRLSSAKLFRLF